MSRTRKGSKGPGWEPWSNKHEKAEQRAAYQDEPMQWDVSDRRPPIMIDAVIMPYRIRSFFGPGEALKVFADVHVRDDEMLLLDHEGHVHVFKWQGRLIDSPPPPITYEGEE